MAMTEHTLRIFKINTVELAIQHRESCIGEHCCISLLMLREMAECVGVVFDEKEKRLFI